MGQLFSKAGNGYSLIRIISFLLFGWMGISFFKNVFKKSENSSNSFFQNLLNVNFIKINK